MENEVKQKTDYQKTLNLPQTTFSMKAGLVQKEPELLAKWQKESLFQEIRKQAAGKPKFTLHDGPPYANGDIHIGHALNKVLKDMIVKYKTMEGYDSWYMPGWDCHGLPIEHQLFKELKKHKSEVDCVDFRKKAHDYAMKYVGIQREQFKRLGVIGDWEKPYLTLNTEYEYWILKSLATLNKQGFIYHGLKPVNWCASCETALAEAEVEYENHTSPSIYVKFEVENSKEIEGLGNKKLFLLVWTTTPWTLLANVAVAVHPAFKYSLVDIGQEILIIESSLHTSVLEKIGVKDYKVIKGLTGEHLIKLTYKHPFNILEHCRVVTTDYVTKEDGTGLVHTAPGHGQDDYSAGVKYNLPVLMPVDNRGIYTKEAKEYAGQHVFKANKQIIEDLKTKGILLHKEDIAHSYPHCWRCKNPIIFRATKQWFLNIDHDGLRTKLLKAIQDVRWIPEGGEGRISAMVEGRPDWCLSRQRYWGVPIPAIRCVECNEVILSTEVIEEFAESVKTKGTNVWFEKNVSEFVPASLKCPKCEAKKFEKTNDILDVWFDSGVSHQAAVKAQMGLNLPVDMYLEGSDQHRGWFQSSLIPGVCLEGKAPYRIILTHGFVVDGEGRKMSKSLGNVVSPQDIIKNSGADILRLWVASSTYNDDIRISKETLDRLIDAYRKIRNTFRYLLGNLNNFNADKEIVEYDKLLKIDKYALFLLFNYVNNIKEAYDSYDFAKAYQFIYNFCNEELSSFYLDILKDRLYTSAANSLERKSAQSVLYHITNHLVRLVAPIISFTADEIYQAMPKDSSMKNVSNVHLLEWLKVQEEWNNKDLSREFEMAVQLRPHVLKALEDKRRNNVIGSSLEAKVIINTASVRDFDYLTTNIKELAAYFIVSKVEVKKSDKVVQGLDEQFSQTEIRIEKADGEKCSRCWNYHTDLGTDAQHPTLCSRCTKTVKEIL